MDESSDHCWCEDGDIVVALRWGLGLGAVLWGVLIGLFWFVLPWVFNRL